MFLRGSMGAVFKKLSFSLNYENRK
jgi:hypothetical protein